MTNTIENVAAAYKTWLQAEENSASVETGIAALNALADACGIIDDATAAVRAAAKHLIAVYNDYYGDPDGAATAALIAAYEAL